MLGDDDVASLIASRARSPSSTAIPTPASPTARPRSSTARRPARHVAQPDRSRHELLRHFVREHNTLVDPAHGPPPRHEAVGGYSSDFRLAQDFDFWLRAVRASASATCPAAR
jgi:hypothetical protein